jgi:ubiquinone/menaquinone biosynthesis C-methylase UbiE
VKKTKKDLLAFYRYDRHHPFAAMYPLLARQIVDDFDITGGRCLDIGTGGAPLLIELGKITDLELSGMDINPDALALAAENARFHGLPGDRLTFLQGDVHAMPLPDDYARLVVSRGSIPFWDDHAAAFREIFRVLQPGGLTFVGGGFSRYQSLEEANRMRPHWARKDNPEKRARWLHREFLEEALSQVPEADWRIIEDGYGTWVVMSKPASAGRADGDRKGASHAVP